MWNNFSVELLAYLIVLSKHLAGDLSVTRLISTYQAKLIPPNKGNQPIKKQKAGYDAEDEKLMRRFGGKPLPEIAKPDDRCALFPCADRGGLLKIAH